jgi:D-alanyl-D-alanine carboxypeptidase/D-alanyl-D-alanine-endopeptidase (penicillin-binding protein 4)
MLVRPLLHRAAAATGVLLLGALLQPVTSGAVASAAVATPPRTAVPAAGRTSDPGVLSTTDQLVHDKLLARATGTRLGPDLAGTVTDALTGQVLWEQTPLERQVPASNTKLVTAVNALQVLGPATRLSTTVVRGETPDRVVLVGAGDPSLTRANLRSLAADSALALGASGVSTVTVSVDDSLFPAPSLAYGWRASYVPRDVAAVRALVVDQHRVKDTSLDAGRVFAKLLGRYGLTVRAVVRHRALPGAPLLAAVEGQPVATMVATMLRESDNDYAEALHRLVAIKAGFAPSWTGARLAQRQVLAGLGVDLGTAVLHDGSGLSRRNRIAPADLVRVLSLVFDGAHPQLDSLQHESLAVAGRTGTLAPRYRRYVTAPTRCAAGLLEAKTGSLAGVITLSGFARGADGRVKLFSFLLNQVPSTLATRRAVDRLAATVTGCW